MVSMESDLWLNCRFTSAKTEISVPKKLSLKEFAKQTSDFTVEIISVTGPKPIHSSLGLESEQDFTILDFNPNGSCNLKVNKSDLSNFNAVEDKSFRIKHFPINLQRKHKKPRL